MTKRYYITDPLQALISMRDFGMRFGYYMDDWCDFSHENIKRIKSISEFIHEISEDFDKLYLHPDSEHLLQPQEGDKDEDGYVYQQCLGVWTRGLPSLSGGDIRQNSTTVRRNNKLFPQCESEDI